VSELGQLAETELRETGVGAPSTSFERPPVHLVSQLEAASAVRLPSRDISVDDVGRMAATAARATTAVTRWGRDPASGGGASHGSAGWDSRVSGWRSGSTAVDVALHGSASSEPLVSTAATAAELEEASAAAYAASLVGARLTEEELHALHQCTSLLCRLARAQPLDLAASDAGPVIRVLLAAALHGSRDCRRRLGLELKDGDGVSQAGALHDSARPDVTRSVATGDALHGDAVDATRSAASCVAAS